MLIFCDLREVADWVPLDEVGSLLVLISAFGRSLEQKTPRGKKKNLGISGFVWVFLQVLRVASLGITDSSRHRWTWNGVEGLGCWGLQSTPCRLHRIPDLH